MAINYNYPTNNQSSKSNPFTGYKYPYPTGGATRPPDNRSYTQRAYDAAKERTVTGSSGPFNWKDPGSWASGYQRFMYDFGHPLESIANTTGYDGWSNPVTRWIDRMNPAAAFSRSAMATGRGDFRQAGSELLRTAGNLVPGGFWAQTAAGTVADITAGQLERKDKDGIPFTKEPLLPQSRDMTMTAEEMAKRAAMERNRTDAAGNSGMGGRRIYADPMVNTRPPGGTTPPPLDLAPLTPEQLNETGQALVELEQVYQDALNQYGLAEKRGQQGYVQDVQGARRQAAGSAQDLASQLAASGMDISPAAAFGAGQMTNAPRMARETSARKTLDQLLAEITTGRTQARTQRDRNKLMTNNQINAYRNQNSFDAQQAAYERMAGN